MQKWGKFRADKLSLMGKDCDAVLDIGQSARHDKIYFENTKYVTLDLDRTINPDIVGDICDMHMISDGSYDGIVCCAILEHVYAPWRAVQELGRITSSGGMLFGYVPFLYGYHAKPGHYSDYYRYTAEGIEYLFIKEGGFSEIEIVPVRGNITTLIHQMPFFRRFQSMFYWSDKFFSDKQVSGYNFFARK